jgi:hypothetical protein
MENRSWNFSFFLRKKSHRAKRAFSAPETTTTTTTTNPPPTPPHFR